MKPYWQGDGITLYHGDCREVDAWLGADVLVTDPPYGIAWKLPELKATGGKSHRSAPTKSHAGIENDGDTRARDDVLTRWGTRPWLAFGSWAAPFPAGHRQVLVWRKPSSAGLMGARLGFRKDTELVFLGGQWPDVPVHRSSVIVTNGNPTLVAAKLQGRSAIGVEIDERYCEIAARRLDQGVLDFGDAS